MKAWYSSYTGKVLTNNRFVYGIVIITLFLISLSALWRGGYVVGGDIWPGALMPDSYIYNEASSLWGYFFSGVGSPQFSPTNFTWAVFGKVFTAIGFSGVFVNYLLLTCLLIWQGVAGAYFARAIVPGAIIPALIVGLGIPISLYNMITFINPIGAFSIGYFAFTAGLILRNGRISQSNWVKWGLKLGIASFGLIIIAGTPPMAVVWVVWVAAFLGYQLYKNKGNRKYSLRSLGIAVVLSIGFNLWWAYAAYVTLYLGGDAVEQTFDGPLEYTWVHGNASIINLLSMQAYWSWPMSGYYPFSYKYVTGILKYSLYVPVLFALIGAIYSPLKKKKYILLSILVISLFIAKGTHAPFGNINAFMYEHLPFYWLLRDPQVEMNIILYLSLYTLAGLGAQELYKAAERLFTQMKIQFNRLKRVLVMVCLTLIVMMNGYSFVNGEFLPETKDTGAFTTIVDVPEYWLETADFLNAQEAEGSVLMLPNNDFYQMPFDWGYYGVDDLGVTLFKHPIVTLQPVSDVYLGGSHSYRTLLGELLYQISREPEKDISPYLDMLGVKWIVFRGDVITNLANRNILSPEFMTNFLNKQTNITKVKEFEKLSVYEVKTHKNNIVFYDGIGNWGDQSSAFNGVSTGQISSVMPWLVNDWDDTVDSQGGAVKSTFDKDIRVSLEQETNVNISPRTLQVRLKRLDARNLELKLLGPITIINGQKTEWSITKPIILPEDRTDMIALNINGQQKFALANNLVKGKEYDLGTIGIREGQTAIEVEWFSSIGGPILNSTWSGLEDCNVTDFKSREQAQLNKKIESDGTLVLEAKSHASCVSKTINAASSNADIFVTGRYQYIAGEAPAIKMTADGKILETVTLKKGEGYQDWTKWMKGQSLESLRLYAMSLGNDESLTINKFKDFNAWSIRSFAKQTINIQSNDEIKNVRTLELSARSKAENLLSTELGQKHPISYFETVKDRLTLENVSGQYVQITGSLTGDLAKAHPIVLFKNKNGQQIWQSNIDYNGQSYKLNETAFIPETEQLVAVEILSENKDEPVNLENFSIQSWPAGKADITYLTKDLKDVTQTNESSSRTEFTGVVPEGSKLLVIKDTFHPNWSATVNNKKASWKHVKVGDLLNGWIIPEEDWGKSYTISFTLNEWFVRFKYLGLCTALLSVIALWFYSVRMNKKQGDSV
ncbi:alpha-(1-_3)-arabinofuranosyltransferase family protein [Paenibacillus aurantiacus]|uniref:Alpha-(1->3)-arabinofuranosyltransferase family protein n=1 Tax=Paenibacillus aurantiacus TaxID=1936118 RepID=A0ABV5KP34_9BACL